MQVELSLTIPELVVAVREWAEKHRGAVFSAGPMRCVEVFERNDSGQRLAAFRNSRSQAGFYAVSVLWDEPKAGKA